MLSRFFSSVPHQQVTRVDTGTEERNIAFINQGGANGHAAVILFRFNHFVR